MRKTAPISQICVIQNMAENAEVNPEFEKARWDKAGVEIMFRLVRERQTVNADNYVAECRKIEMPPFHISRTCGPLFKSMKANGYLRKTTEYKLSERTSKPLPIYLCIKDKLS